MKNEMKDTNFIRLYLQKRKKEPDRYFEHIRI
jgi:hypothetical protein